jgi:linoleoyl-CoA desaturase
MGKMPMLRPETVMAEELTPRKSSPEANPSGVLKLEFGKDTGFQTELRRRVDEWFLQTGRPKRGGWRMHLKTAIILGFFAASYVLLVFVAHTAWLGIPLAVVLGLSTTMIGFCIQHDGGHQAYSERRWVNRMTAMSLDVIGGSSYVWHWKHSVIHHMYVNITGYDSDIDLDGLGRVSPHYPRRWYFRWQRFYIWPFYGLETIKLQLLDDFRYVITGFLGNHRIPRPTGWELVIFIVGKVIFFSLMLAIPLLLHSLWIVLFYYAVVSFVLGNVMTLVFIMPHCAGDADFPLPNPDTGRIDNPWAVHQAQVTLDFARRNRVLTYLLGGLNYHKEHHLFPLICHVNYPAISKIVEETCRDFGIRYKEHKSFQAGLASHYRWLREMGRAT